MKLDKELYRKAHEALQQWSEAKMLYRLQEDSRLSPQEAWEKYAALWEFCMRIAPPLTELQERLRMAEWDQYYANLEKFEAWRRAHGKTARITSPRGD